MYSMMQKNMGLISFSSTHKINPMKQWYSICISYFIDLILDISNVKTTDIAGSAKNK